MAMLSSAPPVCLAASLRAGYVPPAPAAHVDRSRAVSSNRRLARVPGHFDHARLLRALFDDAEEADGVRYPLNRELAFISVRDLRSLCVQRTNHVRRRCMADDALRACTPPHPQPLEDAEAAGGDVFGLLLLRLLLRLSEVRLTADQMERLRAQAPLIGRASLLMDSASRRRFLREAYNPDSDANAESSEAVRALMASFSALQERSWFSDHRAPLAHLSFSLPLSTLDDVPRMACPTCGRQSAANDGGTPPQRASAHGPPCTHPGLPLSPASSFGSLSLSASLCIVLTTCALCCPRTCSFPLWSCPCAWTCTTAAQLSAAL